MSGPAARPARADWSFVPGDEVRRIKARLDHPVIDADGHQRELMPLVRDMVAEIADGAVVRRFDDWLAHRAQRSLNGARAFWGFPVENVLDRTSVMLPDLLSRRLEEIGIDFALLYPSGFAATKIDDPELRQAVCRAMNRYNAEVYDGFRDRLEPVAVIPTHTPGEAIAELRYAVETLGLKTVVLNGVVERPARPGDGTGPWLDTLGHDSLHDYGPVWATCAELRVVPAFHGLGYGWGTRRSTRNYVFNHLGSFAAAQEASCRSLLMGGVPQRFPGLRFAFLEGGVSWAAQLLADLLGHYEKRNRDVIGRLDPAHLDVARAGELFRAFAHGRLAAAAERFVESESRFRDQAPERGVDDFAEAGIDRAGDVVEIFRRSFFFGCEADDPMNALAFDDRLLPGRARLNAMFASDIGHWDVPDMRSVLPEAWELVERGHMDESSFRAFTCTNVARMLTDVRPDFFDGTAIADAVQPIVTSRS